MNKNYNNSRKLYLTPCSSKSSKIPQEFRERVNDEEEEEEGNQKEAIASTCLGVGGGGKKKKGIILSKFKKIQGNVSASSSSSSSTTTTSSSSCITNRQLKIGSGRGRAVHVGRRRDADGLQDLALSIGMSFAAIVSQILDGTRRSKRQIPVERLSLICTSAVKESLGNIYGNRFDCFLLNFERSFVSTLRTLRLINEVSVAEHNNRSYRVPIDEQGNRSANKPCTEQSKFKPTSSLSSNICEAAEGNGAALGAELEKFDEIQPLTTMNNQIVLHGQMNQELVAACGRDGHRFNQSILSTFEKSVMEHTRSNDLKAYEIGLIKRKLQLKESQLALSSYANMLEKIKISMGTLKFSFKEEKLRNQMLDTRHAQFLRRCIDLLVSGLIVMSGCLFYGAYIYSYQRITEATSSCSAIPKESSSWWIPKPMATFNSGWLMLRCHVVSMTRMFFGLAMILAIAYSIFQRSSISTPTTMPVSFILLLGFLCGIAGKLCVDTLGGSGFYWLLHWEALCLLHFFANVFPSVMYQVLYGPISTSQIKVKGRVVPYWFRRFMFNFILAVIYPASSGLLPFASFGDWKEHFSAKITYLITGVGNQE